MTRLEIIFGIVIGAVIIYCLSLLHFGWDGWMQILVGSVIAALNPFILVGVCDSKACQDVAPFISGAVAALIFGAFIAERFGRRR